MPLYLGCDPDRAGAIGFIDTDAMTAGTVGLPADKLAVYIKSKDIHRARLDASPMHALFLSIMRLDPEHLVIEKQQAYKHDSPHSAFTLGEGYGMLCESFRQAACATSSDCSIHHIMPLDWKQSFGLIYPALSYKDKKTKAREFATRLFPSLSHQWAKVKDTSKAEALLIALYALATYDSGVLRRLGVKQPTLLFTEGSLPI